MFLSQGKQIAAVACRAEFRGRSLSSTNDLNIATCRGFEIFVLGSLGKRYCNRAMALAWNDKWGDIGASELGRTLSSNALAASHGCIRVGQGLGQREAATCLAFPGPIVTTAFRSHKDINVWSSNSSSFIDAVVSLGGKRTRILPTPGDCAGVTIPRIERFQTWQLPGTS